MTVGSHYAIAIATLGDCPKSLAPVFQPMRSKTNTNGNMYAGFFSRFERVTSNLVLGILIGSSHSLL